MLNLKGVISHSAITAVLMVLAWTAGWLLGGHRPYIWVGVVGAICAVFYALREAQQRIETGWVSDWPEAFRVNWARMQTHTSDWDWRLQAYGPTAVWLVLTPASYAWARFLGVP